MGLRGAFQHAGIVGIQHDLRSSSSRYRDSQIMPCFFNLLLETGGNEMSILGQTRLALEEIYGAGQGRGSMKLKHKQTFHLGQATFLFMPKMKYFSVEDFPCLNSLRLKLFLND